MKTGRPKKDPKLAGIHGRAGKTDGKKPDAGDTVKFSVPRNLPKQVREKARFAANFLFFNNISKCADTAAFERYVQHLNMAHKAIVTLRIEDITTVDERGLPRKHPANQLWKENSMAALKYEEQFGLTPLSRSRITLEPQRDEPSPFDEFFTRTQARAKTRKERANARNEADAFNYIDVNP